MTKSPALTLHKLAPDPTVEWRHLLNFMDLNADDRMAMAQTTETLLHRANELVVGTYDYLLSVPETAVILGWEHGADEAHLAERRQFFAVWLARTLGLDTSDEFAGYLFTAGKLHAAHGLRKTIVPPTYINGAIGLVIAAFNTYMMEANLPAALIAKASSGWNKYLMAHLHLMLLGYEVAKELDAGAVTIPVTLYARMQKMIGKNKVTVHVHEGAETAVLLQKFFSYYPQARHDALKIVWESQENEEELWEKVAPAYIPKFGWRVLKNGRDLTYDGGFTAPLHTGDTIAIFPPGR